MKRASAPGCVRGSRRRDIGVLARAWRAFALEVVVDAGLEDLEAAGVVLRVLGRGDGGEGSGRHLRQGRELVRRQIEHDAARDQVQVVPLALVLLPDGDAALT